MQSKPTGKQKIAIAFYGNTALRTVDAYFDERPGARTLGANSCAHVENGCRLAGLANLVKTQREDCAA